jgi:hypothetical protein
VLNSRINYGSIINVKSSLCDIFKTSNSLPDDVTPAQVLPDFCRIIIPAFLLAFNLICILHKQTVTIITLHYKTTKIKSGFYWLHFDALVPNIIMCSNQRACENGFHFILTCRVGCQMQNVLQISASRKMYVTRNLVDCRNQ